MTAPVQLVPPEELLSLVDERRGPVRAFIDWAEHRETKNQSMYLANRADITDARQAAEMYPDRWWGIVVFTCFGTINSTVTILDILAKPVDLDTAKKLLDSVQFTRPKVGHHRIQATLRGAKTALTEACRCNVLIRRILEGPGSFHDRYQCLRAAKLEQWGRTTCFDLLVRAGALGIGGPKYEPAIAYLAESIGPKEGFRAVWGRDVTAGNAPWCEGLLQAWHHCWTGVAARVGSPWSGRPYAPSDLENSLCIYQEGSGGRPC